MSDGNTELDLTKWFRVMIQKEMIITCNRLVLKQFKSSILINLESEIFITKIAYILLWTDILLDKQIHENTIKKKNW